MVTTTEAHTNGKSVIRHGDGRVIIEGLVIEDSDIEAYVAAAINKEDAVSEAISVGVRVLRLAATSGDAEMVKREFDKMIAAIDSNVEKVVSDAEEGVAETLNKFATDQLNKSLDDHREKVSKELTTLFGPDSTKSVQNQIDKMLEEQAKLYRRELAQILEKTDDPDNPFFKLRKELKDKADDTTKEFRELRDKILEAVGAEKGAAEESEKGTAKGRTYQELVYDEINRIASGFGDTAEYVADEAGEKGKQRSGDVMVEINPEESSGVGVRVVFEAKSGSLSQKEVLAEFEKAKENRSAASAVVVFSRPELAPGMLPWRNFQDHNYVISMNEDGSDRYALEFAYRCARVDAIHSLRSDDLSLDVPAIKSILDRVSAKLTDFQKMKTNLTGAKESIEKVSEIIDEHQKAVQEDLNELDLLFAAGTDEDNSSDD